MVAPRALALDYGLQRHLEAGPDSDQFDAWVVTLAALVVESPAMSDEPERIPVARAEVYVLDPERNRLLGWDPLDVADAHSADALAYFEEVFTPDGRVRDEVQQVFEMPIDRALIVHDVQVPPDERRNGYGALVVADALLTLAGSSTAVLAHPGPTDPALLDADDMIRLRQETENTRFLAALGFAPFRHRLWMLDLALQLSFDSLAAWRRPGGSTPGR